MALALNNPQRLTCHWNKEIKPNQNLHLDSVETESLALSDCKLPIYAIIKLKHKLSVALLVGLMIGCEKLTVTKHHWLCVNICSIITLDHSLFINIINYTTDYIYISCWPTVVEGDLKVPFAIVTKPRCRRGYYSFSWITLLPFEL